MGSRKPEGATIKTIYDPGARRRVCFYKNSAGTLGFLKWKFLTQQKSWAPTRIGQGSRLGTREDAMREAQGRVAWLAAIAS
jgi:hypothetical protein